MQARRREHEHREQMEPEGQRTEPEGQRMESVETMETVERPIERYESEGRMGEHRDLVHWGPVWLGLLSAFGVLIFLGLLALAVGLNTAPTTATGAPDATAGIISIIAVLIAFAIGGWIAGRTSSSRGTFSGIVTGTAVWALGLTLIILLSAIGLGGLLGVFAGALGGIPTGTAVVAVGNAAVTALIGVFLTWLVTVGACVLGATQRAPELREY